MKRNRAIQIIYGLIPVLLIVLLVFFPMHMISPSIDVSATPDNAYNVPQLINNVIYFLNAPRPGDPKEDIAYAIGSVSQSYLIVLSVILLFFFIIALISLFKIASKKEKALLGQYKRAMLVSLLTAFISYLGAFTPVRTTLFGYLSILFPIGIFVVYEISMKNYRGEMQKAFFARCILMFVVCLMITFFTLTRPVFDNTIRDELQTYYNPRNMFEMLFLNIFGVRQIMYGVVTFLSIFFFVKMCPSKKNMRDWRGRFFIVLSAFNAFVLILDLLCLLLINTSNKYALLANETAFTRTLYIVVDLILITALLTFYIGNKIGHVSAKEKGQINEEFPS